MNEMQQVESLSAQISKRFNGSSVKLVAIDEEFGNVTATVNGVSNVDCGYIEEYDAVSALSDYGQDQLSKEFGVSRKRIEDAIKV